METSDEVRRQVLTELNSSSLTKDRFHCDFDLDTETPVSVQSKAQRYQYFVLRHRPSPLSGDKPWEASESPGPIYRGAETTRFERFEDGIRYLSEWHRRVIEELTMALRNKKVF